MQRQTHFTSQHNILQKVCTSQWTPTISPGLKRDHINSNQLQTRLLITDFIIGQLHWIFQTIINCQLFSLLVPNNSLVITNTITLPTVWLVGFVWIVLTSGQLRTAQTNPGLFWDNDCGSGTCCSFFVHSSINLFQNILNNSFHAHWCFWPYMPQKY